VDSKGCWRENVFVERLWRSVRYEELYLKGCDGVGAGREGITRSFDFYNARQPHRDRIAVDPLISPGAVFRLPGPPLTAAKEMNSTEPQASQAPIPADAWDTGSSEDFFRYYAQQSQLPATVERFRATAQMLLRLAAANARRRPLDVLDVGCGAGAQGAIWADAGHRYRGLDINRPLIELARARAREQGLDAEFEVGSATELPFADESADICVLPFILEHVVDWQTCLDEAMRVLRPGGLLFVSTTSRLCPVQDEFSPPAYGWYPAWLKRRYERLAVTTRPELVNHAKYPAVNWFTVYQLADYLRGRGCEDIFDRFDLLETSGRGWPARAVIGVLQALPPLRWLGHVCTPYTLVVGRKRG
jgi:2-polyprenyl-6-hydroxyphenyl methylase/3-demethylubiquinone-9 3-methyltransferase